MKYNKLVKVIILFIAIIICTMTVPEIMNTGNHQVYASTKKKTIIVKNNKKKATLKVSQSATVKVPGNKKVKWYISSSKNANKSTTVAKLSSKKNTSVKVSAKKKGTCYIRAKVGNEYYTAAIKVVSIKSKSTNKKSYTGYELYLMSHLINGEAGSSWISDEEQRAVGSVVLNRMKDKRFPNTMESVIYQRGQYACTWDGNFAKKPTQRTIKNAKYILENGSTIPKNVVFQSQSRQGQGVWRKLGNHYFCY